MGKKQTVILIKKNMYKETQTWAAKATTNETARTDTMTVNEEVGQTWNKNDISSIYFSTKRLHP